MDHWLPDSQVVCLHLTDYEVFSPRICPIVFSNYFFHENIYYPQYLRAINFTAWTTNCMKKHFLFVLNLFLSTFTAFVLLSLMCSPSTYHRVSKEMLPSLRLTVPMATSLTVSLTSNLMTCFSVGFCEFFSTGLHTCYSFLIKPSLEAHFSQGYWLFSFIKALLHTLHFSG